VIIFSAGSFRASDEQALSDLSKLATPMFPDAAEKRYFYPVPLFEIVGTRGCRYGECTFCDEVGFAGYNKAPHRSRDPREVAEDMHLLAKQHGCDSFSFWDEFMTPEFVDGLAEELRGMPIDVRWSGHTRVETVLVEERSRRMSEAGCRLLNFGFESGSSRVLEKMRKGVTIRSMEMALRTCTSHRIATHCSFIQGYPMETAADLIATAEFIERNLPYIDSFQIHDFNLTKFSELARNPGQHGIRLLDAPEYDIDVVLPYLPVEGPQVPIEGDLREMLRKHRKKTLGRALHGVYCGSRPR
jgi:radical SAM superfamily enzyme YgiQ (UPF0313 family)